MKQHTIKIECECGAVHEIYLDEIQPLWEIVEADEREMGTECLHEAVFDIDCEECKEPITVTLHVWEYPEGFNNMDEILVDRGCVIDSCDLGDFVL